MKNSQNPLNSNANSAKNSAKFKENSQNSVNLKANLAQNSQKTPVIASAAKNPRNSSQNSTANSAKFKENSQNSVNLKANLAQNSQISNPKRKTFWPYGILLSLFAIVVACVATIVFSLDYPVYEDDAYLQKYQQVDNDFNKIQIQDANFKQNFELNLNLSPKFDKKNRPFYEIKSAQNIEFSVVSKANLSSNAIKPTLLLTRPHTSIQNQQLELNEIQTNTDKIGTSIFSTTLPALEKGRWQLKLRLEKDENTIGFFEFNVVVGE